ncbi:MAG: DUF421 domain-containing protein [Tissierellia bacterium]|nr:DUF421 domain-containing protein [Tissierellia bacterium]
MSWTEITYRVIFSFIALLIMARLMGKEHMSQLTFFDYVTGITVGSLAASVVTDTSLEMIKGIYALILWSLLNIIIEFVTLKFDKSRLLISGKPSVLIKRGEIDEKTLAKSRFNADELNMMLRKKDIFDITEVDYAILETSGELTVLKKPKFDFIKKKDMSISVKQNKNLPVQIINKGKIIDSIMTEFNIDIDWVHSEVKRLGYNDIKDIFYAGINCDGQFFIVPQYNEKRYQNL